MAKLLTTSASTNAKVPAVNSLGVATPRAASSSVDELLKFLSNPASYRERTAAVQFVETHISWLFFTDHFVYKLKKPLSFEFLDFSTVEKRKLACSQEVELNRRLARDAYLGVVPIVRLASGTLGMDRSGTPVDWLVKMHRLPADKSMDVLLQQGQLDARTLGLVASPLTKFYGQLPPVSLAVTDYHQRIERHIIANRDALLAASHQFDADQVARIHDLQHRFLKLAPDLLADRVLDGRIIEGHGDLRPEHIFLTSPPVIIDCIEFSAEFRTLDVVDELSFLCMESDALGAKWVGELVLEHYLRASGDQPPAVLLSFYRAYRACVRAKVFALRADQLPAPEREEAVSKAQTYLQLADSYASELGAPVVLLVRGLSGTGKSTIAELISQEIGVPLLQTDVIRRKLFPDLQASMTYNGGSYSLENRARVYRALHREAEQFVSHGRSVVLDGTYLTRESRQGAAALAQQHGAELLSVRCDCPDAVAAERIRSRALRPDAISDADPGFPILQRVDEEPDAPDTRTIDVDTSLSSVQPLRAILAALRAACLPELAQ